MIKLPVEIWDYIFDLVGERAKVEARNEVTKLYAGLGRWVNGPKILVMKPLGRNKDEYEEIIRMLTK